MLKSTSCYKSKNVIASRIFLSWKTLRNPTILGYLKTVKIFKKNIQDEACTAKCNIFHSVTCTNMFPFTFTWYPNLDRYFLYFLETATFVPLFTFNLEMWNFETIRPTFAYKFLFTIHKYWPVSVNDMGENCVKWRFSQMRRLHISTANNAALIFHMLIIDWEWLNVITIL